MYFGNNEIGKLFLGSQEIMKAYLGNQLIFADGGGGGAKVNLTAHGSWVASDKNPDAATYDGYMSQGSKGFGYAYDIMTIEFEGLTEFTLYIRSYGEQYYDYVVVGKIDTTVPTSNTPYSSSEHQASTKGKQEPGTTIDNYIKVTFSGLTTGKHTVWVEYRKDGSENTGDDRGYVLIPKSQFSNEASVTPNLLDGTAFEEFYSYLEYNRRTSFYIDNCLQYNGNNSVKCVEGGNASNVLATISWPISVVSGKTYTFSVYVCQLSSSDNDQGVRIAHGLGIGTVELLDVPSSDLGSMVWKRYSLTFTVTDATQKNSVFFTLFRNGSVNIACPKLEEGSVTTPWCLSENDLFGRPNLLDGTAFKSLDVIKSCNNISNFTLDAATQLNGVNSVKLTCTSREYMSMVAPMTKGRTYTYSVYVLVKDVSTLAYRAMYVECSGVQGADGTADFRHVDYYKRDFKDGVWKRLVFTFVCGTENSAIYPALERGTVWLACPKLEEGSYPTKWRLSANDLAASD